MDLQSLKIDRAAAAPRRRNPWPLRIAVLALLGGGLWLFQPSVAAFVDRVRLPVVRTAVVTEAAPAAAAAIRGAAANGYIVAARRAALSSDVPGRIVELAVKEGSVVKKGDIVARLFADEFRASLQRAEADVATADGSVQRAIAAAATAAADVVQAEAAAATAQAQAKEAVAVLRYLDAEFARVEELARNGDASARDLDRARSDRDAQAARAAAAAAGERSAAAAVDVAVRRNDTAAEDVAVAKAQAVSARAGRDLAKATLDKTDVRAPFDGVVVLKDAEVGEVVSPNVVGGTTARGAVCTMVDFDSLEVQANVPETTLASVRQGAPADVFLDAFPDERYPGVVDRIWPTADRQKATVEVRVKLGRKDDRLRPEMGVRIVFRAADAPEPEAGGEKPRIVVPEQALATVDGAIGAFVLDGDVARFRKVTTGERKGGRVVVATGLQKDQRIVLAPPPSLRDGDRVRVQTD
ncbi:MAG: efflux RND transporter periplasmic adaptor subunit [Planctomycetota bacterium]